MIHILQDIVLHGFCMVDKHCVRCFGFLFHRKDNDCLLKKKNTSTKESNSYLTDSYLWKQPFILPFHSLNIYKYMYSLTLRLLEMSISNFSHRCFMHCYVRLNVKLWNLKKEKNSSKPNNTLKTIHVSFNRIN